MKAFVQNIEREIRAKMVSTELCTPGCAIARVTAQVRGALALTVGQEVTPSPKGKNANEKEKEKGALLAAAQQRNGELKRKLAEAERNNSSRNRNQPPPPPGGGGGNGSGAGGGGGGAATGGQAHTPAFPNVVCRAFATHGTCRYGNQCRFKH